MDVAAFISGLEVLPADADLEARSRELLAELDLRDVTAPKLGSALPASTRRQVLHPPELDAYYVSAFLDLHGEAERSNFARDALVHFVAAQAGYRVWPWASEEAQRIMIQVGGFAELGFVCAGLDNHRVPALLVPWAPIDAGLGRAFSRLTELVKERHGPMSWAANAPLHAISINVPIGVLVLADPPSVDAALALLEASEPRRAPDLDVVAYGAPAVIDAVTTHLRTRTGARDVFTVDTLVGPRLGPLADERVVVAQIRSPESTTIRAREHYPRICGVSDIPSEDCVLEVVPARAEPNRKPRSLCGRDPSAAADRPFFARHPFLVRDELELPSADYVVLHDCTVGAHGSVIDARGHWVEDACAPYYRARTRAHRSAAQEAAVTRVPGVSTVVMSGGTAHTHWLVEGLMRLWAFQSLGVKPKLILPTPLRGYQARMFELLGYTADDLLETAPNRVYACETLVSWLFDVGPQRELVPMIEQMCAAVPPVPAGEFERIFVPRTDVEMYRNCMNEGLLVRGMEERGFTTVVPGELSADDEIRVFRAARTIVGPLGAGIYNSLFSRPGATVLAYCARSYMEPHLHTIAQILDHDVHYLFAEELASPDTDPASGTRNSNFVVRLPRFFERVDALL